MVDFPERKGYYEYWIIIPKSEWCFLEWKGLFCVKRKRILPLVLALCLCANMLIGAYAADATLKVEAPKVLPAVGETFEVTISLGGNPGLGAVQFTLLFDQQMLECTGAVRGDMLQGSLSAVSPNAEDGIRLAAATTGEISGDGTLLVCTFKVLRNGEPSFALDNAVMSEPSGEAVDFQPLIPNHAATEQPVPDDEEEDVEEDTEEEEDEDEDEFELPLVPTFKDVSEGHWAYVYIEKAVDMGLISGYSDGSFRPGNQVTRAQFVTMLWRMAGKPASSGKTPFTDISGINAEFQKAIAWAYENEYIGGRTATTFAPSDTLTRQAAMKVLYLYSGGVSGQEVLFTRIYDDQFADSGTISAWAKEPLYWAVYNELISGTTVTTLGATRVATRGQLAKILVNYVEKID